MDTINAVLQPYSQHLQNLTVALIYIKLLRGFRIILLVTSEPIRAGDISVMSLMGALLLAALGLRLAQLNGDNTMEIISRISLFLNMIYIILCYYYATARYKRLIWEKLVSLIFMIYFCFRYSLVNDPDTVKYHLGMARTVITSCLIIMGLLRNTGTAFGSTVSVLIATSRLLYALSIWNTFMLYQNLWVLWMYLFRTLYLLNAKRLISSGAAVSIPSSGAT